MSSLASSYIIRMQAELLCLEMAGNRPGVHSPGSTNHAVIIFDSPSVCKGQVMFKIGQLGTESTLAGANPFREFPDNLVQGFYEIRRLAEARVESDSFNCNISNDQFSLCLECEIPVHELLWTESPNFLTGS